VRGLFMGKEWQKRVNYYDFRPNIKNIDIIGWKSSGPAGKTIRFYETTFFRVPEPVAINHVGLVYKVKDTVFVIESLEKGLELNLLSKRIHDGKCYILQRHDIDDAVRDEMALYALELAARSYYRHYDFKGCLSNMTGKRPVMGGKLYCSELVYKVYEKFKQVPGETLKRWVNKDGRLLTPRPSDLYYWLNIKGKDFKRLIPQVKPIVNRF
jgi:hypothetical protein